MRRGAVVTIEQGDRGAEAVGNGPVATDADLVALMGGGDRVAFGELIERHLPAVAGVARRMLRDDAEAEDVAQEAMLRLWRQAGRLEIGPAGLRPWLRRVVSNLCIDRLRVSRHTDVVDDVPEVPQPARQVHAIEEREAASRVDSALQSLPERQRLALVLFHYEGMSQIEVGTAMGITDEAVESLLSRARRSLRTALADDWRELISTTES